jgi:hypothetical protein
MTCEQCRADYEQVRSHQRFCSRPCRNAYWNARQPTTTRARRAPHADTGTEPRPRRSSGVRRRPRIGTQTWLTDPTVRVCKVEGCHFDAGTCRHGRAKN